MRERLNIIVLHTIKYSDKNSIVHALSRERGRVAFLLPLGNTAKARQRNAMFMPLSLLEVEASRRPGSDLLGIAEARYAHIAVSINADPVKNAVAMFTAELMGKVVRDSEESAPVFDFASMAIRILDSMTAGVANFHICFLYHLGAFIGIQPDTDSYSDGYGCDMMEGTFTPYYKGGTKTISPDEARTLMLLSRMTFANLHLFRFSRAQRNRIVELMIQYYQMHGSTLGPFRTPDILAQLF